MADLIEISEDEILQMELSIKLDFSFRGIYESEISTNRFEIYSYCDIKCFSLELRPDNNSSNKTIYKVIKSEIVESGLRLFFIVTNEEKHALAGYTSFNATQIKGIVGFSPYKNIYGDKNEISLTGSNCNQKYHIPGIDIKIFEHRENVINALGIFDRGDFTNHLEIESNPYYDNLLKCKRQFIQQYRLKRSPMEK